MGYISTYNISKNKTRLIGIYLIHNSISNKSYVGSASYSIYQRWSRHINDLNKNKHHNYHLQRSWNLYGPDAFKFLILETCLPIDCTKIEQYYLDAIKPEYNILKIANSRLGKKHTNSAKNKMSLARKGKKLSIEHRKATSLSLTGKKRPYFTTNLEWRGNLGKAVICIEDNVFIKCRSWADQYMGLKRGAVCKALKKYKGRVVNKTFRSINKTDNLSKLTQWFPNK